MAVNFIMQPPQKTPEQLLHPLPASAHSINDNVAQRQHFIWIPSRLYLQALFGEEARRLLVNLKGLYENDAAQLRIAGDKFVNCLLLRPNGGYRFIVESEIDVSSDPVEPRVATGTYREWNSHDYRRWCLLNPKGDVIQEGYTSRDTAAHAASVRNTASPEASLMGR